MTDVKAFCSEMDERDRWWAKAFMVFLTAQAEAEKRARTPKPPRDPEWQKTYDEVVRQIHDPLLDKELANRITDSLVNGILTKTELDGWVADAKENVRKFESGDHKYGRRTIKDTIHAKVKKFFERCGFEWTPPNGGVVGEIKTAPKKKLYGINAFGERVEID